MFQYTVLCLGYAYLFFSFDYNIFERIQSYGG